MAARHAQTCIAVKLILRLNHYLALVAKVAHLALDGAETYETHFANVLAENDVAMLLGNRALHACVVAIVATLLYISEYLADVATLNNLEYRDAAICLGNLTYIWVVLHKCLQSRAAILEGGVLDVCHHLLEAIHLVVAWVAVNKPLHILEPLRLYYALIAMLHKACCHVVCLLILRKVGYE